MGGRAHHGHFDFLNRAGGEDDDRHAAEAGVLEGLLERFDQGTRRHVRCRRRRGGHRCRDLGVVELQGVALHRPLGGSRRAAGPSWCLRHCARSLQAVGGATGSPSSSCTTYGSRAGGVVSVGHPVSRIIVPTAA